ncbi:TadE family protein [Johnsonella ignava]|jgi:hypothetical protein|uniref:TadE family protein n=1 Tax=Johnsonella ignava TaxID=43995 RepID=UPI0023F3E95D|nr:TadE family protein [Johnsonella ignava]
MDIKKLIKKEKGQGIVEFALVFPIFLAIMLAIIDFSWIAYQSSVFNQGYAHASWEIGEKDLVSSSQLVDNIVYMQQGADRKVYSGLVVENAIKNSIKQSSLWGFKPSNLIVTNAVVEAENKETSFDVPSYKAQEYTTARKDTRYMKIRADIEYRVVPLTFFGRTFFGDTFTIRKSLNSERTVAELQRTE